MEDTLQHHLLRSKTISSGLLAKGDLNLNKNQHSQNAGLSPNMGLKISDKMAEEFLSSFKNQGHNEFQFEGYERITFEDVDDKNKSKSPGQHGSGWAAFSKKLLSTKIVFNDTNIQQARTILENREKQERMRQKALEMRAQIAKEEREKKNSQSSKTNNRIFQILGRPQSQQDNLGSLFGMNVQQQKLLMTPMDSKSKDTLGNQKPIVNIIPPIEEIKELDVQSNIISGSGNNSSLSKQRKRKEHDDKKPITMDDVQVQPFKIEMLRGRNNHIPKNSIHDDESNIFTGFYNDNSTRNAMAVGGIRNNFMFQSLFSDQDKRKTSFLVSDNEQQILESENENPNELIENFNDHIDNRNQGKLSIEIQTLVRRRSCQCKGCFRKQKFGDQIVLDDEKEFILSYQKKYQEIVQSTLSTRLQLTSSQQNSIYSSAAAPKIEFHNSKHRESIRLQPNHQKLDLPRSTMSHHHQSDMHIFLQKESSPNRKLNTKIINPYFDSIAESQNTHKSIQEIKQGPKTLEEIMQQYRENQKKEKMKKDIVKNRKSSSPKPSQQRQVQEDQKRLDKIRQNLDRKLGLDLVPEKINSLKVYLTSTKEYQEALKYHRLYKREVIEKSQASPSAQREFEHQSIRLQDEGEFQQFDLQRLQTFKATQNNMKSFSTLQHRKESQSNLLESLIKKPKYVVRDLRQINGADQKFENQNNQCAKLQEAQNIEVEGQMAFLEPNREPKKPLEIIKDKKKKRRKNSKKGQLTLRPSASSTLQIYLMNTVQPPKVPLCTQNRKPNITSHQNLFKTRLQSLDRFEKIQIYQSHLMMNKLGNTKAALQLHGSRVLEGQVGQVLQLPSIGQRMVNLKKNK